MKSKILSLTDALPNSVSKLLLNINRNPDLIYGSDYKKFRNIDDSIYYDNAARLLGMVNYAIKNVPYYRNLYSTGFDSLTQFEEKFGFIDKEDVVSDMNSFKSGNFDESKYDLVSTGGTSGRPLKFYAPKTRYAQEWATVHNAWKRVGFNFDTRAVLRNHRLKPNEIYNINPITKEIQFDNFRLTDEYMGIIYKVMKEYGIKYMHAYTSAAYQFATFCYNERLDISFLKAFLCASENVYEHQLDFVKSKLGTRIFSHYGHSEKLIFGSYCEDTDFYHVDPFYGFFELLDSKGKTVNKEGEIGEMVGSTLNNFGMPLIRYRTGDFAEYLGEVCPKCGRKTKILRRIIGRWNGDKIYNKDGSFVTATALNLHNEIYAVINGLQYFQQERGKLIIYIIPGEGFNQQFETELLNAICSKLSEDAEVKIEYVEQLRLSKNGKFQLTISELN